MARRVEWHSEITEGGSMELERLLNRLDAEGWTVEHVMPNGVNRWTVTASRRVAEG